MKKNILIVNWGTKNAFFPLAQTLASKRHNIYLASSQSIPIEIKRLFHPNNLLYTNTYDAIQLCQDAVAFQNKNKIVFDIVTTFFEMNVFQTSFLADYLDCKKSLKISSAIHTSVNKYLMRSKLATKNLNQPFFFKFNETELNRAYNIYKKINKTVIIKPIHSGHSYGARKIDKNLNIHDFKKMFASAKKDLFSSYDEWMDYQKNIKIDFLIEEFIPGKIFSIDGIVKNKNEVTFLGTAEFEMTDPPLLQQIGHTVPIASLNASEQKKCFSYTKKIIEILGLQYCGFHCELKFDNNQPMLIEISGRLPGGAVLESYHAISKINIFDAFLHIFEDKKRKISSNYNSYMSETRIAKFIPWKIGEIKRLSFTTKSNKNIIININSRNKGDLIFEKKQEIGMWLYDLKLQSKSINSKQLIKNRNQITVKYSISLYMNIRKLLHMIKYHLSIYLVARSNKLKSLLSSES